MWHWSHLQPMVQTRQWQYWRACKVVVVSLWWKRQCGHQWSKRKANKDITLSAWWSPSEYAWCFETSIKEMCQIIHDNGNMVYMDGANMNAQVGLTSPGIIGTDVCHLNLHKTLLFLALAVVSRVWVPIWDCNESDSGFLPNHSVVSVGDSHNHAVSAAPYGSTSILLISYGYIRMLRGEKDWRTPQNIRYSIWIISKPD